MRVLQVGLSFNPGGIESFVMNYYRRLVKQGIQFDFICMYGHLAYEDEIRRLGGKIFNLPNVKKNPVAFIKGFQEILLTGEYETVHVNMLSAANILPLKIAHQMGIKKIIAHSHNTQTPGILRKTMHFCNKRKLSKYANTFWACSKAAGKWMFGKWVQEDQIEVINNAIDLEQYLYSQRTRDLFRQRLGISDGEFVLGHVGRMEEQKNHAFLLQIFAKVLEQCPSAWLLLIGDGILRTELEEQCRDMKIEERVLFLGVRNDVSELFSVMDVFVFPSLYEGLSVTTVEAQCAGLPCIVSASLPKEMEIGDKFIWLPLEKGPQRWSEEILALENKKRDESANKIICRNMEAAGFSINIETEKLKKLYAG